MPSISVPAVAVATTAAAGAGTAGISAGTASLLAAGIGGAASLGSSLIGSSGAKGAAGQASAAADQAAALQQARYEQTRSDLAPYTNLGNLAGNRLINLFGLAPPPPRRSAAPIAAGPGPGQTATPPPNFLASGPGADEIAPGWRVIRSSEPDGPGIFLTDASGNVIKDLNSSTNPYGDAVAYLASRGVSVPGVGGGGGNDQTNDVQMEDQAGADQPQRINEVSLPGPGSALMPYAPPNGGVFAPEGGSVFTPEGGSIFKPTIEQLEQTPGYQFTLAQGLRAAQTNAAARGLGVSGSAMKAAAQYATGLADTTLQTQANIFGQNYTRQATQFGDNYNRQANQFGTNLNAANSLNTQFYDRNVAPLFQLAALGQNAAATTGNQGIASAATQGGFINSGGISQAAGTIGAANAFSGAAKSLGSAGYNYLMSQANGQPSGGGGGTWDTPSDSGGGWDTEQWY